VAIAVGVKESVSDSAVVPPASGSSTASRSSDTARDTSNGSAPAAPPKPPPPGTLKSLVLKGSAITLVGFGSGQVLRLFSNLILTRLLVPEAFGFMSLSYALLEGLAMFSAVGEGPAIVRDKRGDEPDFVNTAWTVQVIRGNYLWIAACILAWPMSLLYGEPLLVQLVPVVGFTCVLEGFYSSSIHLARRHMSLGRLTFALLVAQFAGIFAMVSCAFVFRTVWALPVGGLVENATMLLLSHFYLPGIPSRFRWEKDALRALRELGKWIFLSSMLEFIARQSDRLLLAYYVEMATLGIYAVAVNLSEPIARLNMQMSRNVMMPALSRTHRDAPERMAETFYKGRLGIDAMHLPILGFISAAGPRIVELLYDNRYLAAGWMLQVICVRTAIRCFFEPSSAACTALGAPKYVTLSRFVRASAIILAIPIGWRVGGLEGMIWGTVLAEVPTLCMFWFAQWKLAIFKPVRELLAFLLLGAGWITGELAVRFGMFDQLRHLVDLLLR
jgi:O-antigen/teichoic acid export membrane protein